MRTPHLISCVITAVIAVAPITAMSVTTTDIRPQPLTRTVTSDIVQTAAIKAWQPNIFETLDQIQKLGVSGVDVLIPASGGGTTKPAAVVIAGGVSPTAAATTGTAAGQQPMAAQTQTSNNATSDQLSAYMQQLAASMAILFPPPAPSVVPPGAKKIFSGDYSTGNLTQWAMVQAKGINGPTTPGYCTYSACVRYGGLGHETAARFEVRDGDVPPFGGGERAEVLPGAWNASRTAMVKEGDERWYTMSVKFDETWQNPRHGPDSWFMVTQWFPQNGTTVGPALTLQVTQDNYLELGGAGAAIPYRRKIAPIRPGQWEDYVVHVKFSEDPNVGFVEVYQNGKLVVERHNRPTLSPGGGGAYIKQGVYRDAESTGTQVVWHDGLTIYEGVTPPASVLAAARTADAEPRTQLAAAEVANTEEATDQEAPAEASEPTPPVETTTITTTKQQTAKESDGPKESDEPKESDGSSAASVSREPTDHSAKRQTSNAAATHSQDRGGVSAANKDKDDAGSAKASKRDNDSAGAAS